MAITIQDLVDTACLLAGDAGRKRGHDAELLIPRVLTWVGQRAASDPKRRALVATTHTLALVDGEALLPANVLIEFMDQATVSDPADPALARKMRWIPEWREFIRPLDQSLGYFTVVQGSGFHLTRPGTVYTPGAGMAGDIDLTTPTKPAVSSGLISTQPEVEQEIILALVAALRGDWQPNLIAEVVK